MPSPHEELLDQIRGLIDFEVLYREFLPSLRGRGTERHAFCIFHRNTHTPALSVNVDDGRFYCHNPSCGVHGSFVAFYRRVRNLQFRDAVNELAQRCGLDPIEWHSAAQVERDFEALMIRNARVLAEYVAPDHAIPATETTPADQEPVVTLYISEENVIRYHERLLADDITVQQLIDQRGLTRETVERFQIGWDGQRYYIPIRDGDGRCVNIRRYQMGSQGADKMLSWRGGYGAARLWPLDSLDGETVYLCEGEMDCMLAIQHGVPAITTTGGAGTWKPEWTSLFDGKHVVICYDNDSSGHTGAAIVGRALLAGAASVKSILWPYSEPEGFDFTDYIHGKSHTVTEFYALVAAAGPFEPPPVAYEPPVPDEIPAKGLADAGRAENVDLDFMVDITISGIGSTPMSAPLRTQMYCGSAAGSIPTMCPGCPLRPEQGFGYGALDITLHYRSNQVLGYRKVTDAAVLKNLKAVAGIPAKCPRVQERRQESINLLDSAIMPDVAGGEMQTSSYQTAKGYVTRTATQQIGNNEDFLIANRSYRARMRTVADPKTQDIQHIILSAVASQADIDVFQMTASIRDELSVFTPDRLGSVDSLIAKAGQVHEDLERFTRTYERRDLMMATDLTYLSPIGFVFQGDPVVRGWVECLVIGDSRTGKTQCIQRLLNWYGAGEFSTGENTSFAGLVAGLTELINGWFTRWGKVPLNDRRLLVIDEAGNLPTDQIARMSSMRSSGVAEIIKIHTERTRARTRQVWMANPRGNKPLAEYSHGVLAVKELIGAPEDIARFDIIITAAATDVDIAIINAERGVQAPQIFSRKLCNQRIMWAWSRKPDHIEFLPEATQEILRLATVHSEQYRYATSIPLVEPNEQRIKLARLAASAAAFFFSASPDGQNVIVRPEHVMFVYEFLNSLYAKPSLAYASFAETEKRRFELHLTDETIRTLRSSENAVQALMEQEQLTPSDLMEVLGIDDRARLRATVTALKTAGFLRRKGNSYFVKTPAAIIWLREEIRSRHTNGGSLNGNGTHAPDVPPPVERSMTLDHARAVDLFEDSDDIIPPW